MANVVDISVHAGEPWVILFTAHESDGTTIMPLGSGADVEFRLSDEDGDTLLTKNTDGGVVITNEQGGTAEITITEADQADKHLFAGVPFWYEIRVIKGEDVSVQNEGNLLISDSLYGQPLDPLLSNFKLRFPEFTEGDTIITVYLADAARVIARETFWDADDIPVATVYLAAHYLKLRLDAKEAYESASTGISGDPRIIRVEDQMVAFDTSSAKSSTGKSGLSSTLYGQHFLAMRRRYPIWKKRA